MTTTDLVDRCSAGTPLAQVFLNIFHVVKSNQVQAVQLHFNQTDHYHTVLEELSPWFVSVNKAEILNEKQAQELQELMRQLCCRIHTLLLCMGFLHLFDKHYEHVSRRLATGMEQTHSISGNQVGNLVMKHSPYPLLWEKYATYNGVGLLTPRGQLWEDHLHSFFHHFHVIFEHEATTYSLSGNNSPDWLSLASLKIGISQMCVQPTFSFHGDTDKGVKFRILGCEESDEEVLDKIKRELELAHQQGVSLVVIPELIFPDHLEHDLLTCMNEMAAQSDMRMVLIVGCLHTCKDNICTNHAKIIVPREDDDCNITYTVLYEEIKRNRVSFKAQEKGTEQISPEVYEKGAIEHIDTGNNWSIIETPLGRLAVLICKDFLESDQHKLKDFEVDLIIVCAMTPTTRRFIDKANVLRAETLSGTIVANNGWFVEIKGKDMENYSYVSTPTKSKNSVPIARTPKVHNTLEVVTLYE